jgi:hypothetical protein
MKIRESQNRQNSMNKILRLLGKKTAKPKKQLKK